MSQGRQDFETLWAQSSAGLSKLARSMENSKEDAEDLLSETCLRAFRGFGSYSHKLPFRNWACRIMANLARDRQRNKSRRVKMVSYDGYEALTGCPVEFPYEHEYSVDSEDVLKAVLSKVRPSQVPIVRLLSQGFDRDEISAELKMLPITVRSRIYRMRKVLAC